jgi:catechol 2,3-dioxygenase-like lactoylglutathione lyase family enzyme
MTKSKLLRMDNVGIVVESLDDAISFFTKLGLTLDDYNTKKNTHLGPPLVREKRPGRTAPGPALSRTGMVHSIEVWGGY